jgi:hypothetical protein
MRVVKEEIFGPVVCVQSFDDADLDQVAKFANDTEYGLQASIWTRNLKVAHTLARKIKAGTICVNSHNYGDPAWPFGGFKQSGWGREMGKEVMEHYTETKSVGGEPGLTSCQGPSLGRAQPPREPVSVHDCRGLDGGGSVRNTGSKRKAARVGGLSAVLVGKQISRRTEPRARSSLCGSPHRQARRSR